MNQDDFFIKTELDGRRMRFPTTLAKLRTDLTH